MSRVEGKISRVRVKGRESSVTAPKKVKFTQVNCRIVFYMMHEHFHCKPTVNLLRRLCIFTDVSCAAAKTCRESLYKRKITGKKMKFIIALLSKFFE